MSSLDLRDTPSLVFNRHAMMSSVNETPQDVRQILAIIDEGNDSCLRRLEDDIRRQLRISPLTEYRRTCLTAVLGLLTRDWYEAERHRIHVAEVYTNLRCESVFVAPERVQMIDDELRHLLLARLTAKQEANAPRHGLRGSNVPEEREARAYLRKLGLGFKFAEFKKYPERVMDHENLRKELERKTEKLLKREFIDDMLGFMIMDYIFGGLAFNDFMGDTDTPDDEQRVWEVDDNDDAEPDQQTEEQREKKRAKNRQRNERRKIKNRETKAEARLQQPDTDIPVLETDKHGKPTLDAPSRSDTAIASSKSDTLSAPSQTNDSNKADKSKLSKRQKKTLLKKTKQAETTASNSTTEINSSDLDDHDNKSQHNLNDTKAKKVKGKKKRVNKSKGAQKQRKLDSVDEESEDTSGEEAVQISTVDMAKVFSGMRK